jgi:hypothetical protein
VRLYFKDSLTSTQLYHPVPRNSNGSYIEGVHYAKCDDEGNFEFNFSFQKSIMNIPGLMIELFVQKENDAIKLESPNEHHTIILQSNYSMPTFTNTFMLIPFSMNWDGYHEYSGIKIDIDQDDGKIFRYATLSRMFVKARYNLDYNQLPFNPDDIRGRLPLVNVNRLDNLILNNEPVEAYYDGDQIKYRTKDVTPRTVIHEYGHYLDDAFNEFDGTGGEINSEGWAMFYSTAVLSWLNHLFGDEWNEGDNCEIAPFFYLKKEKAGEDLIWERFGSLNKVNLLSENGRKMCRLASYLYQVYDSKSDGDFMPNHFQFSNNEGEDVEGLNNDDVDGLGFHLFDFWRQNPNLSHSAFNNDLKNSLASVPLQNSIQKIYNYMDFELDNTYDSLNPAQVKNFHLETDCQNGTLSALWESGCYSDGSYPEKVYGPDEDGYYVTAHLYINPFSNKQFGYHVYINGQQNTVSSDTYSFVIDDDFDCNPPPNPTPYCHSVSSYIQDDSYNQPYFCYPPIEKRGYYKDNSDSEILIFPNPAANSIEINLENINSANSIISLYDNNNKLLNLINNNTQNGKKNKSIDISNLSNGFYYLKIQISQSNGYNQTIFRKFIINK